MDTIPQNVEQTRRACVTLAMSKGQSAMQSAIAVLVAQGPAGEPEAGKLMKTAAHYFAAAAVILAGSNRT